MKALRTAWSCWNQPLRKPPEADVDKHYTIGSSHGELSIEAIGLVTQCRADNDDADGGRHLKPITRFDVEEWRKYWGDPATDRIDILDLGYWYADPEANEVAFAPPDAQWRPEIAEILVDRRATAEPKAGAEPPPQP